MVIIHVLRTYLRRRYIRITPCKLSILTLLLLSVHLFNLQAQDNRTKQIAALQEEIQKAGGNEKELTKKVLKALKAPSIEYRNAALNFASPFAGKELYTELAKTVHKGKPDVQTDVLKWFGRESATPAKNELIKNLEVRFDLTFNQLLAELLKNKNQEVRNAAARTMAKIGDASAIPALANLLTNASPQTVELGKETLLSFKGDTPAAVARIINQATDSGKVAALEILSTRKASSYINYVYDLTKSSSPEVRNAAYAALKEVADDNDFTRLCGMLETAEPEYIKPLQQAVIASVVSLPQKEQTSIVSRRILQAEPDKKHLYDIVLEAIGDKTVLPDVNAGRPVPFTLSPEEAKDGFKILFDGTNMYQWTGNTVNYTLNNDGTITLVPSKGTGGGNLYTKDEYSDFVYRFEFMLTPAANNGVGIRTPVEGDAAYVGMEIQILDNEDPIYKDLHPYQYHGSVYGIIPARRGFLKPVGEWNTEEIMAKGDQIRVTLNGEVILDGNIRDAVKNGTPDGKEHPGLFNRKGHIGFLGHGDVVKFRNIRIKELK